MKYRTNKISEYVTKIANFPLQVITHNLYKRTPYNGFCLIKKVNPYKYQSVV